ncbi:MAG: NmrA family protein, partial [Bacteroidota bacterium]
GMLSALIKIVRKLAPAEDEIFPAWQGMQYMRNMIDERANLNLVDNERYPNMHWTTVRDVLSMHQVSTDMNSK